MKSIVILKEFSALSPDLVQVRHATVSARPESPAQPPPESAETEENFREMQHQRYTAPFPCPPPYHHWGINE